MSFGPANPAKHSVLPALFFGDFILSLSKDSLHKQKKVHNQINKGIT
jgi:hypothetical protein